MKTTEARAVTVTLIKMLPWLLAPRPREGAVGGSPRPCRGQGSRGVPKDGKQCPVFPRSSS